MKRVLFFVPVLLFILLNACANNVNAVAPPVGTAVGETQTASVWTPTISPTPDPDELKIVEWLNAEFANADTLEQTLDAKYQAVDVSFPIGSNGAAAVLRMDVRCECSTYGPCCTPERTFVVTIGSMKKRAEKIIDQVPGTVSEIQVVCYDHVTKAGVMSASWMDVKGYFLEQLNGYQLGSRVYRSSLP